MTDSNIVPFPIKGTKIAIWYNQALSILTSQNLAVARAWVGKNTPAQFHQPIVNALRRSAGREDNTH